jgi:hypothetical protein
MFRSISIALLIAKAGLAQDAARMDQVVQSYVSNKTFMGSVLVARGEQVLFSEGYSDGSAQEPISESCWEARSLRPGRTCAD